MDSRRPQDVLLAANPARDFAADQVKNGLAAGQTEHRRRDNNSEYTSNAVLVRDHNTGVDWHYITPSQLQQNAFN